MKKLVVLVAVFTVLFGVSQILGQSPNSFANEVGALVTEESLLSPNKKQIVFVVSKNIAGPTRVELQTHTSEGLVNNFAPLQFPQGLQRGQIIPIWDGELTAFQSTPWLYFWVTITTPDKVYYSCVMFAVNFREQYKEPKVLSISETGGYSSPYQITVRGIFDTTIPTLVLINTNYFVPVKSIVQTAPGKIEFSVPANSFVEFPTGKYLLTICQAGHCDTLIGRHQ